MTAYNPITTMQRLQAAGIVRKHAEALANELHTATTEVVTKAELDKALAAQSDKLTIRICGILGGLLTLGFAGVAVALSYIH